MKAPTPRAEEPASAEQLAAALTALGLYSGDGSPAEHAAEAARLGERRYRLRLANALLGAAQIEAMLAETLSSGPEDLAVAHDQQLATAGVTDYAVKLAAFLQRQALRVSGPLRVTAQDSSTGPIPRGGRRAGAQRGAGQRARRGDRSRP